MIGDVAIRIFEAWLICAAIQTVLWVIAKRTKNAGIVDVGWALSFSAVVALFAVTASSRPGGWLPIAVIAIVWSGRLGLYLISRGAATGPEEGRYVELRRKWQPDPDKRFLVFFQVQAALTAVLATALVVPFVTEPWDGGGLRAAGAILSSVGIAGEALADAQLARWKRNPMNRGAVCDTGLWGYSRHPNYFFEWCVWVGYAVAGFAYAPWGLIALAPQAIILASIYGVTGIPPTEKQALRSKGEAYAEYQRRVSRFVPMPPKRARPST